MSRNPSLDVRQHLPVLRRYARALAQDATLADDLVQQALLRAYERSSTFREGASLRAWLLAIVHNQFVTNARRLKAERTALAELAQRSDDAAEGDQEWSALLNQVTARFSALPEAQRAVLHLISVEGLSYQETADALAIPIGTVMSRLSRARAALRAQSSDEVRGPLRIVGGRDVG